MWNSRIDSDDEVDIASVLTGNKLKKDLVGENSDDELSKMIQSSTARRNVKGGVDVVKKAQGKAKMTKGEVGGGSFQSMGRYLL
jgi:ATP-dependent RNA helicase DDX54/DBP10